MLIDISGARCVSCRWYTQHYRRDIRDGGMTATNYGFCGRLQRCTNPGRRCRHYMEESSIGEMYRLKITEDPPKQAGRA